MASLEVSSSLDDIVSASNSVGFRRLQSLCVHRLVVSDQRYCCLMAPC